MGASFDEWEADARAVLPLFCFGETDEYTVVSQQIHPVSGTLKLELDERVLRDKAEDTTLYIVRATAYIPSAQLNEVLPIVMGSSEDNIHNTAHFIFGGKATFFEQLDTFKTEVSDLSIQYAEIDQTGMLTNTRWQSTYLDFQTTITPDWRREDSREMHVRLLQSIPDALEPNDKAFSPRAVMVRELDDHAGVQVQLVLSFVETRLINLPRRSRYQRIASNLGKLEEVVVSRRMTNSFRVNAGRPFTWVDDSSRLTCHICVTKFRMNKRRHHCRLCGEVACDTCVPKVEIFLPGASAPAFVRVCTACIHQEPEMMTSRRRSIVESISEAMYYNQCCNDTRGSTANSSMADSCSTRDSGCSNSDDADDRLLNWTLRCDSSMEDDSCCACCRDTLGAIRYECSKCEKMVCKPCNLQVQKRGCIENVCRVCVAQTAKPRPVVVQAPQKHKEAPQKKKEAASAKAKKILFQHAIMSLTR
ncbi:unnamed protein product [Aphanomyces euteiches]|uniref:FYVE-type domain-containing protein n=1 Tax=Aphanomyces euteiches TaxID=100861 RepID=A0A6G0XTI1_9STRA|nr:hypothetical protein Ae201684_001405 [Aphanomyces euteiches]KAH9075436.1 hypothetical protein Ae201684P_004116 [Aphanomyces euteiches]KAH9141277.1 hypothetical protein AeRB84_014478 [Aphanomyces euteiches]KAH9142311.1 hypothetical protein AeRB84_013580 [Aphanomyces euteiches]KAH9146524.1 hypothetical protein AeRB84_009629 [Aphanomyces euteiches]